MRRKEREITDPVILEEVLHRAEVCRLGLCDDETPYIVPMSFGFEDNTLYFHAAAEGRKIDLMKRNPQVCFEVETDVALVEGESTCSWTMRYTSIVGTGTVSFLTAPDERHRAVALIAAHYGAPQHGFSEKAMKRLAVFSVTIQSMSGKRSA